MARNILLLLLFAMLTGCAASKDRIYLPKWLHEKIIVAERNPDSYTEVWAYKYRGQTVYLFLPGCCDRMSELYSESGKLLCRPGGGITGKGDGRCNRFYKKRKHGMLLWKPRNPID